MALVCYLGVVKQLDYIPNMLRPKECWFLFIQEIFECINAGTAQDLEIRNRGTLAGSCLSRHFFF